VRAKLSALVPEFGSAEAAADPMISEGKRAHAK
jgi:hypothetical protein